MKYSKECLKLAELCWEGNKIRCTSVYIGNTYKGKEGIEYKITEDTYRELLEYQNESEKKFKVSRHGKKLNLIGVAT